MVHLTVPFSRLLQALLIWKKLTILAAGLPMIVAHHRTRKRRIQNYTAKKLRRRYDTNLLPMYILMMNVRDV